MHYARRGAHVLAVLLLVGCGGGGRGAPSAPPPSITETEIRTAIGEMLDTASTDPAAALENYQSVLANAYAASGDPIQTADDVARFTLQSLIAAGRWSALLDLRRTAPDATSNQPLQSLSASPSKCGKSRVYFINGIMNLPVDAYQSSSLLANLVYQRHATDPNYMESLSFTQFYNRSGLLDPSLPDACATLGFGVGVYTSANPDLALLANLWTTMRDDCMFASGLILDIAEAASQWANTTASFGGVAEDAMRLAGRIRSDIDSGMTVILVAHSQGNLFVEQALAQIPTGLRRAVGVVAVASPTAFSGGSTYGAIEKVKLRGDILNAFGDAGTASNDPEDPRDPCALCWPARLDIHSFAGSYLRFPKTRDAILAAIDSQKAELRNPLCCVHPVTVYISTSAYTFDDLRVTVGGYGTVIDRVNGSTSGSESAISSCSGSILNVTIEYMADTYPADVYAAQQPLEMVRFYDSPYVGTPRTAFYLSMQTPLAGANTWTFTVTVP